MKDKLVFEKSAEGRIGYMLPKCDVDEQCTIPNNLLRKAPTALPQLSEPDVVRHYVNLAAKNHGVDNGFYPLGSCTMKYNPKINEYAVNLKTFAESHPLQPDESVQGNLEVMYSLSSFLCEICAMDAFSLQPAAGAHGELAGLMIIKSYLSDIGQSHRNKIIIPDSAHGTNPASAIMAGFEVIEVKSDSLGNIDVNELKKVVNQDTAGLMLTNPNTLGLFELNIKEIADIIHSAGGYLYYDGANMNAIMGITRPGDMGFDIVHINLHKTFSTPHGGGGPGSGPVGVKEKFAPYLPIPVIGKNDKYYLDYDKPKSIGKIRSFAGNFPVALKAYCYILSMGCDGLKAASETAVLNANYLMKSISNHLDIPYKRTCMHEFVASGEKLKQLGSSTLEAAKRMLDFGIHPPTVYFPLIVKDALMIEPTETESKETLDEFIKTIGIIIEEATNQSDALKTAPHTTPVRRLDETKAARQLIIKWEG